MLPCLPAKKLKGSFPFLVLWELSLPPSIAETPLWGSELMVSLFLAPLEAEDFWMGWRTGLGWENSFSSQAWV